MNDLIIISSVTLSLILIWIDAPPFIWFRSKTKLDIKPFNCSFCLAFWTGLTLSIITGQIFYLTLPLLIRIIEKKLL